MVGLMVRASFINCRCALCFGLPRYRAFQTLSPGTNAHISTSSYRRQNNWICSWYAFQYRTLDIELRGATAYELKQRRLKVDAVAAQLYRVLTLH